VSLLGIIFLAFFIRSFVHCMNMHLKLVFSNNYQLSRCSVYVITFVYTFAKKEITTLYVYAINF